MRKDEYIQEIAARLIILCNELKFVDAYTELYTFDAVSIDPNLNNEPLTGLHNLIDREQQFWLMWKSIRPTWVPIYAGSYFSVVLFMNFTVKGQGAKTIDEICLYKVDNGKIVSQVAFLFLLNMMLALQFFK